MKVTRKGEYALRAMTRLASRYQKGLSQIKDISKQEKIPKKFLESILVELKNAGLIRSKRGFDGGYELCRAPESITLAEAVRIIDGPLAPLGCVSQYAHVNCPDERTCRLKGVMQDVRNAIAQVLEGVTFADICQNNIKKRRSRNET